MSESELSSLLHKMKGRRPMFYVIVALLIVLLVLLIIAYRLGLHKLASYQPIDLRGTLEWKELSDTPEHLNGYTPQALEYVDSHIVFANSWKNTQSRVYRMDPNGMEVVTWFDMPSEAVHTSGFGYDGTDLWAVDYISNRCYKIALNESFASKKAVILGSFSTGLRGTSACCTLQYQGESVLAISDFMRTSRTYIIRPEAAIAAGNMKDAVIFSYENEGFSQGLVYIDGYLYESENKFGMNVVNKLDLVRLRETESTRRSTVTQYLAPNKGVEDLAWDGTYIYTSDEKTFKFYKAEL